MKKLLFLLLLLFAMSFALYSCKDDNEKEPESSETEDVPQGDLDPDGWRPFPKVKK